VKIMDFLRDRAISVNLEAKDKESVIREMVKLLVKAGEIKPADEIEGAGTKLVVVP